jgi:DNA-binding NarL/FixJ family response regulator
LRRDLPFISMTAPDSLDTRRSRIVLVDDHALLRMGLRQLFAAERDLEVVADVGGIAELRDVLTRETADLLVLDLGLRDDFALAWLPRLREQWPALRILVLSSHAESLYADRALRAGAQGYMMKSAAPADLLAAVRRVLAGQIALSAAQQQATLQRIVVAAPAGGTPTAQTPTPREIEVLRLIAAGHSTVEIARLLHRSVKTIETHKQALKVKLGAGSPAQLVRMAIAHFEDGR